MIAIRLVIAVVLLFVSIHALADEVCNTQPDGSNSCGGGTVGDLGLGGGTGGGTGVGSGGGGGGTATLPRMEIVRPRVDVEATSGGGLGFWAWLYQGFVNLLTPPDEIDFLCGNLGVDVLSTADAGERARAANLVAQSMYQGLGGQGRPYVARIIVFYTDGGLEAYTFVGTSSNIVAVPGTLQTGLGAAGNCKR